MQCPQKLFQLLFEFLGSRLSGLVASYFSCIGSKEQRAVSLILCIWPEARKVGSTQLTFVMLAAGRCTLDFSREWEEKIGRLPRSPQCARHSYNIHGPTLRFREPQAAPWNVPRENIFTFSPPISARFLFFPLRCSLSLKATRLAVAQCMAPNICRGCCFDTAELRNTPFAHCGPFYCLFLLPKEEEVEALRVDLWHFEVEKHARLLYFSSNNAVH